ncbi:Transketolase [Naganishia friedmannii]|uniref:Transketolase n=1 Tax=Naganishia friedmannii TaxID=89922 RepID=A0ACC2VRL1_9TREE|nr:Transketolase [Naganishia friedmannii]
MSFTKEAADERSVNTIRALAADVVAKANSGHPGAPMGMAPVAHILFTRFMHSNPKNPKWYNRDRFVLSNGHACALQYCLLHLMGYKVSMDDLKQFRQLDSITPGHPEVGVTPGIEVTTGPLGQGFANAVGLAMAQAHMGGTFNKDGFEIFNNHTFMFTGDGCLQEGVASEAASLAGHLQLGNLIAVYDDNHITIDGDTNCSFTEDVEMRFKAYGWEVLHVNDGNNDLAGIAAAIEEGKKNTSQPTLIRLRTIIGYGSKEQGTGHVHGAPLKSDDIAQMKQKFGFNPEDKFFVPSDVSDYYAKVAQKGAEAEEAWNKTFASYKEKYPTEAAEVTRRMEGQLPEGWEKVLPTYTTDDPAVGSRKLSETVITKLATVLPEFIGGSADLTGSNLTRWKSATDFQPPSTGLGDWSGKYIRFGIREHAMVAIANGLCAYGGIIPFTATFLNFVSYAAGAVRLSALSHFRVLNIATHDSIGLGEDGPTHQPVETVAWLRALPNMQVWRPADGNETSAAYLVCLKSTHTPSTLCFSRQNLPQLANSSIEKAVRGAYVLEEVENNNKADLTLVSTGSEVCLCLDAVKILREQGLNIRLVSMPCQEIFKVQSNEYKLSVLPSGAPVMSVEAYTTFGWGEFAHESFGLPSFGASAPAPQVYEKFGLTGKGIAEKAQKVVSFYKKRGGEVVSPLITALGEINDQ